MEGPSLTGYTIYTKSECGYCRRAKELLPKAVVINCDVYLEKERIAFLLKMDEFSKAAPRTFPMIFSDGVFVGGYDEIKKKIDFNTTVDF